MVNLKIKENKLFLSDYWNNTMERNAGFLSLA